MPAAPFSHLVTSEEELRATDYPAPLPRAWEKEVAELDEHCAGFLAQSPIAMLATSDETGRTTVTPRGGPPAFVRVLDPTRVAWADLTGNRRIDAFRHIMRNPQVGLLLLIPGLRETLRIDGTAYLTRDPEVLRAVDLPDRTADLAVGLHVRTAFLQCGKAMIRSRLWEPASWPAPDELPSPAAMIKAARGVPGPEAEVQAQLDVSYATAVVIASGVVTELHRWPVKSMGGEPVGTFALDPHGVAGDRAHALYDVHQGAARRLTARQSPRLLAWHASYGEWNGDVGAAPPPTLTAPDGTRLAWDDPALPAALADDLGRGVELRTHPTGQQDLLDSVLVTTQATHDAVERELGRALDARRWRTNVLVELDAAPFAEEEWEGRSLTIGEASFTLLHPCVRCVIPTRDPDTQEKAADLLRHLTREHGGLFGMNARPLGAARIRVGDAVRFA